MTGISGASELRHQPELKLLLTACLCVDISRPSLCQQLLNTSVQYIWQYIPSLNLAVLVFSSSCLLHFSFFHPFPGVPLSPAKDQAFSHRECCWRLGHCFLLQGKKTGREGGEEEAGQADFLAANTEVVSVWEKARETDLMMTEDLCVPETDFSEENIDFVLFLKQGHLYNFITGWQLCLSFRMFPLFLFHVLLPLIYRKGF